MICIKCNNEVFIKDKAIVEQIIANESYQVETSVSRCTNCGQALIGNNQLDELVQNTRLVVFNKRKPEIQALLADEKVGCSREHLDKLLSKIALTRTLVHKMLNSNSPL